MHCSIAIIGEFDKSLPAHATKLDAVKHSAKYIGAEVEATWLPSMEADDGVCDEFDGVWLAAGRAYENFHAVNSVIKEARERSIPLLGTCRGFQQMVLEFARNVLEISNAEHEERDETAPNLFLTKLPVSLARRRSISITEGTPLEPIYSRKHAPEVFFGNYGVNPSVEGRLTKGGFISMASDSEGNYRAGGIARHPFFKGSLFVPQLRSTKDSPHPLVTAFLKSVIIQARFRLPSYERYATA